VWPPWLLLHCSMWSRTGCTAPRSASIPPTLAPPPHPLKSALSPPPSPPRSVQPRKNANCKSLIAGGNGKGSKGAGHGSAPPGRGPDNKPLISTQLPKHVVVLFHAWLVGSSLDWLFLICVVHHLCSLCLSSSPTCGFKRVRVEKSVTTHRKRAVDFPPFAATLKVKDKRYLGNC
jgi:hypothetical protein